MPKSSFGRFRPVFLLIAATFLLYLLHKNHDQGDIIAILDSAGAIIVEYYYDAWGRQYKVTGNLKDSLGKLNPFRYRGYVYDEETGLYYLHSRYYNPEWERCISSDSVLGEVGAVDTHNLFAYCGNNPVMMADPDGKLAGGISWLISTPLGEAIATFFLYGIAYACKKAASSAARAIDRGIQKAGAAIRSAIATVAASVQALSEGELQSALLAASISYATSLEGNINSEWYYFAFVAEQASWNYLAILPVPLTKEEAVIIANSTTIVNELAKQFGFGLNQWGFYTNMEYTAYDLAYVFNRKPKAELSINFKKPGDYYWHYHDEYHLFHIWFGTSNPVYPN